MVKKEEESSPIPEYVRIYYAYCPIFFIFSVILENTIARNILALLKLLLAFTQGHRGILGETHEHGGVFFYIMPSNRGPQRAASNPAKRDNSSLSLRSFVRVHWCEAAS